MRNAILAVIVGALIVVSSPARAGGVFDDSGDSWHFIAGMIVQEWREDQQNVKKQEEQRAREEMERQRERDRERERMERDCREKGHGCKKDDRRNEDESKMSMLFDVHRKIVNDVLEESREATDFIMDIYDGNGRDFEKTAQDVRPFVYDYFEVFDEEQGRMYNLWVDIKFKKWLDSYCR